MTRACVECGVEFETKRPTIARYCSRRCKDRTNYRAHRESRQAQQAEYRRANRGQRRNYDRARYAADPEAERQRRRDNYRRDPQPWRDARDQRRAAVRANDSRQVTSRDWRRLLLAYGNRCAYCGGEGPFEPDHVIPISRGGRHAIGNLVPACFSCNRSKFNHFLSEWRYRERG